MANSEESNLLLPNLEQESGTKNEKKSSTAFTGKNTGASPPPAIPIGWTADGQPVGEPMERFHWDSGIFSCLGRNDEFCSSDLEVCLLGSVAPCVLYGSNVERLGSAPGTFANHCLPYTGLYLMGIPFSAGIALHPGSLIPSVQPYAGSLIWREVARHSRDHAGVAEALWRTRLNVSNVKPPAILPPTSYVMSVPFVRRDVRFAVGSHILGLVPNQSW